MSPPRASAVLLAAALAACSARPDVRAGRPAASPGAGDFCPAWDDVFEQVGAPSTDLYCIELIASPELHGRAGGVLQLTPPPSPFGASVTRDGVHRFATTISISGLPDPTALGDYSVYIAWAAPPALAPLTKLGTVANGRVEGSEVALNKFYVLVSAEASDTVTERRGPLVLRGLSASTRMRDPHFLVTTPAAAGRDVHDHGGWRMPPHDPRVPMAPMGIEHLAPQVTPFLPQAADAPLARARELMQVRDGDTISLTAGVVRRRIKGRDITMYGFNAQYPGPLIAVREQATITIDFHNRTPHETAIHWHGIRLDNRFDGVPHVTQEPVAPGGSFRYTVHFPDAGIYWYHPHHREDIQQDLGLYGNLMVHSPDSAYYAPAHREEVLMLDDILLGADGLLPYGLEAANFAVMGRFGNVLLVNGEPTWSLSVKRNEVVRFHLTNASSTRTFNISFADARMKVVASDVGRFEREEWVESVVLAPAERYVIDVMFERPGIATLTNRVQAIDHMMGAFVPMVDTLGAVTVTPDGAAPDHRASFARLRTHSALARELDSYLPRYKAAPLLDLELLLEDRGLPFDLTRLMRLDTLYFNPVEWSGTMPMMDWLPTVDMVRWILRDAATGAENEAIIRRFRVGDVVHVRLRNNRHSLHAMQHPIHIHGQRFLVHAVNGVRTTNRAWKDTVLVPAGMAVDLLLEIANPGRWMLHCHIAEHLEGGMKLIFDVER